MPLPSIAARLGEVGLPEPVAVLASMQWDAVIIGGGHNGLTCAAYLARAGKQVLVLEQRERLGGACTLERPFADQDYVVSPCAYVVGLLDQVVIDELDLTARGLEVYVADPNLWAPFPEGGSFAQWLDDEKTQASLESMRLSRHDIDGYWAYEHIFDEMRQCLRTRGRDTWIGESPTRPELEELLGHDQWMTDILFNASISEVLDHYVDDRRLKDALFGQGVIGAYAGPEDEGTASVKLMHYQGDLHGRGPVWGYVRGGMGVVSFAIAEAAEEAGAVLACGVPVAEILPGEGVRLAGGELIRAPTIICNADPKRALDDDDPGRADARLIQAAARRLEGPQPGGEVQRGALAPADVHGRRRGLMALPLDGDGDGWSRRRAARFPRLRQRPRQRRLRRGLLPDRLRPHARSSGTPSHERVRSVRPVRAAGHDLGRTAR